MTNEEQRARSHAYYLSHKEKWLRVYGPRAIAKRGEKYRAYMRTYFPKWYAANRDKSAAYKKAWRMKRRSDPATRPIALASAITNEHRRRARLRKNLGDHTTQEWLDKCELLGNVCFYCGEAKPLTRDHKVPLFRGGTNDITNILPACRSCNRKKWKRTTREYLGLSEVA